jgi:YaiO family outer membrane protein
MLVLGLCCYSSHAVALEVIEGVAKRTAVVEQKIEEAEELREINDTEYCNEVVFDFDKAHISDLKTYWTSGTLSYHYVDEYGRFGAAINRLKKFDTTENQYQIDLDPRINDWAYTKISFAEASRSQTNFPSRQYHLEAYFTVPNNLSYPILDITQGLEFSIGHGGKLYKNFGNQKLYTYTVSLGYEFDNCFAWFRPTYNTPNSLKFYEAGMTKYFEDQYNYVSLSVSTGRFPSIGDIIPLDQLVTAKQSIGGNLSGQFGMTECLYLRWGFGYARIVYPYEINRYTYDGKIGLLWRF